MLDEKRPLAFGRTLRRPELWLLIIAAISAMSGIAWWVMIPLVVAGLSIASLPTYIALWPRARESGAQGEWWRTVGLSLFNSLGTACSVHLLGLAARWFWF